MDKIPIHDALYSELCRIESELRKIDKEVTVLEAKRTVLLDSRDALSYLMRDYGEFIHKGYKPKEEEEQ